MSELEMSRDRKCGFTTVFPVKSSDSAVAISFRKFRYFRIPIYYLFNIPSIPIAFFQYILLNSQEPLCHGIYYKC